MTAPEQIGSRGDLCWLDLCSGLGGASQPALDRGWRVIRVDIDPQFKPDIVADVRALPLRPFRVDVLWASPPCQDFTKWGMRCFFPNPPAPDVSIAQGVARTIIEFNPPAWFVENVWASRPWLSEFFGGVRNLIPGHTIWSNTLVLLPNLPPHKGSCNNSKRWGEIGLGSGWSKGKVGRRGAAANAKIPYEIGEAICRAVERRAGLIP